MSIGKWAGTAIIVALATFASAPQADCDWEKLGERAVGMDGKDTSTSDRRMDHDEILVTRAEGSFKSVQLRVQGSAVEFDKVIVHFANGSEQTLQLREKIPSGSSTRTIDLKGEGDERAIRKVEFDYRVENRGQRATVELWGVT